MTDTFAMPGHESVPPVRRDAGEPRLLRAGPPPHWHGAGTVRSASWTWVAAALVVAAFGIVTWGRTAVGMIAISVATAVLTEAVLNGVLPRRIWAGSGSSGQAVLTGLLVALTLPPHVCLADWRVPVVAALLASGVGRALAGGYGNYLWHPVALARVGVELLFGAAFASQPGADAPFSVVGGLAALARDATPFEQPGRSVLTVLIRDYMPPWGQTLLPTVAAPEAWLGPLGGYAVGLVVAALLLVWRGHVRRSCVVWTMAAAMLTAMVLPIYEGGEPLWFPGFVIDAGLPVGFVYVLYHLTGGELLFVVVLLAGDSVSSPLTSRGQRWFGAGLGVLTIMLRRYGLVGSAGFWALLAMNTLVPLINWRMKRHIYGTRDASARGRRWLGRGRVPTA
ncbi:MAG: RnfABCDGE type electron transport complex subunit D [Phycisphaerae bacterium]|nr:RnfABCDGE type electron transport complex subunit D [Phycisphaerae bacterium]